MKRLLFLYPVFPFLDEDPAHPEVRAFYLERVSSTFYPALGRKHVRGRFELINYLLDQYREEGYRVTWLHFSRFGKPDVRLHHDLFRVREDDDIVPAGIAYEDIFYEMPPVVTDGMIDPRYPDEAGILSRLCPEEVVIGGFHESDCVQRFRWAAREQGIPASVDSLITDSFFFDIVEVLQQDLADWQISRGYTTRVLYGDPLEEKVSVLQGRVPPRMLEWKSS